MTLTLPTSRRHLGQLGVLGALAMTTCLCLLLTVLRIRHSGSLDHSFLLFNLALAWLPVLAALAAYNLRRERTWAARLLALGCGAVWLLFLPNAPYLLTDLVHLSPRPMVPFWYDVLLLSTFAWTGLFLGLVSLVLMQDVVRRSTGTLRSWLFVVATIGLAGYGVYMGRFLRWNSWDLVMNPWPLATQAAAMLRHPLAHYEATVFSLIFAAVFGTMYTLLAALAHFARESHELACPAPR